MIETTSSAGNTGRHGPTDHDEASTDFGALPVVEGAAAVTSTVWNGGNDHIGDGDGEGDPYGEDEEGSAVGEDLEREDPEREATFTLALFEGDDGGLEPAQRRALVVLIKQRFITARTHPKEWAALVAKPRLIRSRLNDLFLDLHLDAEREVAHKRQVAPEGGGRAFPTLLHDAPWGREETILLIFLRTRHRSEQAGGADRAFVDRADMHDFIAQHRPERATDVAGDARKAARAVESIYKSGLLIGSSTGDRFEVSNAIEVLLPVVKLQELLAWLRAQNGRASGEPEDATGNTEHRDALTGSGGDGPQLQTPAGPGPGPGDSDEERGGSQL